MNGEARTSFFVLAQDADPRGEIATIGSHPDGLGLENYEFQGEEPLGERFPDGTAYGFDPDLPDARKLVDLQPNTLGLFICSPALREILSVEPNIEWLPISVANHRGKPAGEGYAIANFLNGVDCIDEGHSEFEEDDVFEGRIEGFDKLVIDPERVPEERSVFRLARRSRTVILTADVKARIDAEGMTGVLCVPVEEFASSYYLGV